jgi:hypothetical protein
MYLTVAISGENWRAVRSACSGCTLGPSSRRSLDFSNQDKVSVVENKLRCRHPRRGYSCSTQRCPWVCFDLFSSQKSYKFAIKHITRIKPEPTTTSLQRPMYSWVVFSILEQLRFLRITEFGVSKVEVVLRFEC